MKSQLEPSALDLASGAGGLALGLYWAGWRTTGLEIDHDAVETHRYNVGECIHADMTQWQPGKRTFDLVTAGVPCQTFSHAGKRGRFGDPRGLLFNHVLRICDLVRPRLVLLENTAGILDEGSASQIVAAFMDAGFDCTTRVLNAADYSVPQRRVRWFLVAAADSKLLGRFQWPERHERQVTSGEVLGNVGGYAVHNPAVKWWQGNRIIDAARPAPTVTTTAHDWIRVQTRHGIEVRRMDIPELAALQTFPKTNIFGRPWRWFGLKRSIYRQIGNAVPPTLGAVLGEALLGAL